MTDLTSTLASLQRLAEEVKDLAAALQELNSDMDQMRAELRYSDFVLEHAPLLASAVLALVEVARALEPFVGFADVLNPGNNGHSSFGIYMDLDDGKREYVDAEGAEKYADDKTIIAAGAGWPKVPASYVTELTMGDFRKAHAALTRLSALSPKEGK